MTKEQQDQIQAMLNEWSKLDSPPDMAIKIFSEALTKSIQKEEQKRLIIEIMNEDAKDGLYEPAQTATEWLFVQLYEKFEMKGDGREMSKVLEQAKKMEEEQSFTADELKAAYHAGYLDAKTNHINDADEYVNAQRYLKSKKP